ncbi:hypothetical protein ABPG74_002799 [Tetrahymena malaccensis]
MQASDQNLSSSMTQSQTRKSSSDSTGSNTRCFNIQLCGNSSVGKTSIIHRLIYDNYLENTVITLGVNYYKKNFVIQGEPISVTIHDTSGQERYIDITKQSVRKADALILVYDKTSEQSFQDLESLWISQFDKIIDLTSIPLLLIGNKSDLYSQKKLEQVSYDQADQFARQYNMAFFETSALSGAQIQNAFDSLVQRLYLSNKQKNNPPVSIQKKKKSSSGSKNGCC